MEQTKKPLPGAVLLLAALGFVLGTCEFVIVGILPEIAEGLNTSLAAVGKLVSVFAACYAVGTPVITAATGGISRRKLLAVLMGVFLLTSAASFAAPNVAVLYATRVVAALVSGTLTAVAMLYAKEVAAPEQTARAISLVYGGFSVAAVLGVPLGTAVCQILGWRWTFAVILAMGAALLPLLLGNRWAGLAGVFAMGLLMYLLNTPAQMHALSLAEQDYPFASSLCASVQPVSYNFGIAIGSFIGSAVQEGWGSRPLGLPAAMFALAALGLNLLLLRANGRRTAAAAS